MSGEDMINPIQIEISIPGELGTTVRFVERSWLYPAEKEYPSCDLCGSPNVSADAAARWDYEKQEWTTTNVFDKGHSCDDCEDECKLTWVKGDPSDWEPT